MIKKKVGALLMYQSNINIMSHDLRLRHNHPIANVLLFLL